MQNSLETGLPFIDAEDAHESCAIEWWFVQGCYTGAASGRRHFMLTLFRLNLQHEEGGQQNGFQLLSAVLDAAGQHHAESWIDSRLLQESIAKLKTRPTQIDPMVQRALALELEARGAPSPIIVKPAPAVFNPAPLEMQWDSFLFHQDRAGIQIRFREPHSGRSISLQLDPQARRMDVACGLEAVPLGTGMVYHNYPRLKLTGIVDANEPLTGEAWLDHQWGDNSWLHDPHADMLLGWDWFGINLADGSDWLIMLHRNARTGEPMAKHATTRAGAGPTLASHEFVLSPLRLWESPLTHIHYPVAWRIEIPAFDACLVFEPLCDDQEIPSFGINRSVWEGAGIVTGTVAGREVTGRARGEFHGYGYVFDHEEFLRGMGRRVDARLEELLPRQFDRAQVEKLVGPARWQHEPAAYTEMISTPVWDLIDRSGKRWRPLFGLLLLESLGVSSRLYEGLICMSELIHVGALIVDDIEDASLLRRGLECLHLRYGMDVALNAGNALYFLPSVALMQHPLLSADQRLRLHGIKEQTCIEAHCGQATDIYWSKTISLERLAARLGEDVESKILQMYAFKTAAASKGVGESAAAIAGAAPATATACRDFGLALGVAYQIIDDIHNFSRSPKWSKTTGEDIASGKLTYVIATALRQLDAGRRARLAEILCSPEMRKDPASITAGAQLVRDSGALETCHHVARQMLTDAWAEFAPHLPSSQPKIMLHAMTLKLIDLAFDG